MGYKHTELPKLEMLWPRFKLIVGTRRSGNPVKSAVIESALHIQGSTVRDLLNYGLKYHDFLLCSSGNGYFIPGSKSQAQDAMTHLYDRKAALDIRISLSQDIILKMPTNYYKTPVDHDLSTEDEGGVIDSVMDSLDVSWTHLPNRQRYQDTKMCGKLSNADLDSIWDCV